MKNNNKKWKNKFRLKIYKITMIMMMLKNKMIKLMKKIKEMIFHKFQDLFLLMLVLIRIKLKDKKDNLMIFFSYL